MFSFSLFAFSGIVIAIMLLAKRFEEKKKGTFFVLKAVSRGDEHMRELHHKALHFYSIGKDKTAFMVKKQLPMRAKNIWNKLLVFLRETIEKYMGDVRNSRLLKKPDGISEFFKSISDIERGNGEITDVYEERQEILVSKEIAEPAIDPTTTVRKYRTPRKKKLTVIEGE